MGKKFDFVKAACVSVGCLVFSSSLHAVTLKMATQAGAPNDPAGQAISQWASLIEEKTNGEVNVQVYYENELGGSREVFDLHVSGAVDLLINWPSTSYDQRVSVIYTPYMFYDWSTALEAYGNDGWLHKVVDEVYSDINLKFLGVWPEGFAGIGTKKDYDFSAREENKLRIRSMSVYPGTQTLDAMGYSASAIDWAELYTALQTGVVDGDGSNIIYWSLNAFKDVLNHYVSTNHMFTTAMLSINKNAFDKLDDHHKKAIVEASKIISNQQFEKAKKADEENVKEWLSLGKTYYSPSQDELEELANLAREKVWPDMADKLGEDIMSSVLKNSVK